MPVQQLTRRRDVRADLGRAREAAVRRHDVESVVGLSAWIVQLHVELSTLPPPQRGV
jgi:hypothetical protein